MTPLVKPETALRQRRALCSPNSRGIPIAAWQKDRPLFLHGIHEHQVASAMQLDNANGVAVQGLAYGASRAVDEPASLVEVRSEANLDTRSRQYSKGGLRRRVAEIPCFQVFFADAMDTQGSPAHVSGASVGASEPGEYVTIILLQ